MCNAQKEMKEQKNERGGRKERRKRKWRGRERQAQFQPLENVNLPHANKKTSGTKCGQSPDFSRSVQITVAWSNPEPSRKRRIYPDRRNGPEYTEECPSPQEVHAWGRGMENRVRVPGQRTPGQLGQATISSGPLSPVK